MDIDEMREVERIVEEKLAEATKAIITGVTTGSYRKIDSLINPEEAASYLNVKLQTLALWRSRSIGPSFVKIERSVKYRLEDLDAYIKEQSVRH